MNGDVLDTVLVVSFGVLALLSVAALLIAVCLPHEKRSAILRHLGLKWIV